MRRSAQLTEPIERGSQMSLLTGRGRGEAPPPQGWWVGRAGSRSALSGELPGTRSSAEPPRPTAAGEGTVLGFRV